jgi:hypothetical protein
VATGLTPLVVLFVVGLVFGYVVTIERTLATRVQSGMLLGLVLLITPLVVSQVAKLL